MKKVVFITGATSGIGAATAKKFAKKGYHLILTGRREDRLKEMKNKLKDKYAVKVKTLCFDIQKKSKVKAAIKSIKDDIDQIDILVNNAGLARGLDPIHKGKVTDWEEMIDTNIKGLLYLTRLISPKMVKRGRGHIINVGSTAGHDTYPNGNVYAATKFAVKALTKSMAIDLHPHGIKVGMVSPGHVETEFASVRFHGDKKKADIYGEFTPLKAKDVAESIYFMATQPKHVNIQEILLMCTQQAGSNFVFKTGRND